MGSTLTMDPTSSTFAPVKVLPLPESWLSQPPPQNPDIRTKKDAVLSGRRLIPGTKTWLKTHLSHAGWSYEDYDPVIAETWKVRPRLSFFDTEVSGNEASPNEKTINDLYLKLKGQAPVTRLPRANPTEAVLSCWDSLSLKPSWLGQTRATGVVLCGLTPQVLHKATAALVLDLWKSLGEGPDWRMPEVKRYNLLSWCSTEVAKFGGVCGDLSVVYGSAGPHHLYSEASYLEAMTSVAKGLVVYECVLTPEDDKQNMLSTFKRNGFQVLGVGTVNG
jgi:hypothetical protein